MLIQVNSLTKELRHCKVLDNINLEFCSGKIYGIVGANGSGKTMLLRALRPYPPHKRRNYCGRQNAAQGYGLPARHGASDRKTGAA